LTVCAGKPLKWNKNRRNPAQSDGNRREVTKAGER
jgi:hypothetical protein